MDEARRLDLWKTLFMEATAGAKLRQDVEVDLAEFYEHVRPAFYRRKFEYVEGSSALPLGMTRIEWLPDLPSEVEWPSHEGQALDFLAQINLADLEPGFHPLLPERGWLYFFAGPIWDQNVIPHQVLYYDGQAGDLVRMSPPADLKPPERMNTETALIEFAAGFSIDPGFIGRFGWDFGNDPAYAHYEPLYDGLSRHF